MTNKELSDRFKLFALNIIKLADLLPKDAIGNTICRQIVKSGTSSAANYRSALRGRSDSEFISKLCIVEEELDETMFWIEMIIESNIIKERTLVSLFKEANELLSITIVTKKSTKLRIANHGL